MAKSKPDQKQDPGDETRDEQRAPPPTDPHQGQISDTTTQTADRERDAPQRKSQDTDPDSPDADIDRDDMIDEP